MKTETIPSPSQTGVRLEDLEGAGLFAPGFQATPLPLRQVEPSPCGQACPAGLEAKAYVSLIAEERFGEALEVIRRRCPLPGVCGRVCTAPCEEACVRGEHDEPIAIRALKRFVSDMEPELALPAPPPAPNRREKIAIIGSGPAGLTAAYDLRLAGYPVTVFEAEAEPGGMLRYGIVSYRLPRETLDREIEVFLRAGIEIKTGMRIGTDLDLGKLTARGYKAVLLAVGAQMGRQLGVPGEDDRPEVEDALAFLRRVNAGDRTPVGEKVLVIGGGSTAIEAARSARRLGAKSVEILYRRTETEVLASAEEVEAAQAEGVRIRFLTAPRRVIADNGTFKGLECSQVGLGDMDSSGRRRPIVIPGTEFLAEADQVFAAVGQQVDLRFLPSRSRAKILEKGKLTVDPETTMTKLARVFAAGDMVSGPSTIIAAIAGGHRSASSIRRFIEEGLPGVDVENGRNGAPEYEMPDAPPIKASRLHPGTVPPAPGREFEEVELAFTGEQAVAEAQRCLRCGPCSECRICAPSCQRRHVTVRLKDSEGAGTTALLRAPASVSVNLDPATPSSGWVLPQALHGVGGKVDTSKGMEVEILPTRNWVQEELCRACGTCVAVCPYGAVAVADADAEGGARHAHIDPTLCRGCNLCVGACPTHAAIPATLSPVWWGKQVGDAIDALARRPEGKEGLVVLTCQQRLDGPEPIRVPENIHAEVIPFRCVGQVNSGFMLDLLNRGAPKVLVAGCDPGHCRYGTGASLAAEQVEIARSMLGLLGQGNERLIMDWSPDRSGDRLEDTIARLIGSDKSAEAPRPAAG